VDFSMSATPASSTVTAGGNASFTITVTPGTGGFANAVALTDSGLPTAATGTFVQATVTPGNTAATSTLTITTTARTQTIPRTLPGGGGWPRAPIVAVWLLAMMLTSLSRMWLKGASRRYL